jgi:hypothetical protein
MALILSQEMRHVCLRLHKIYRHTVRAGGSSVTHQT